MDLERLATSDDPLSTGDVEKIVDAYRPQFESDAVQASLVREKRSSAMVILASRSATSALALTKGARADEDLSSLLTPVIRSKLADTAAASLTSAFRFLSDLLLIAPNDAHAILTADGILDLVLEAPEACKTDAQYAPKEAYTVTWSLFEMISSAANNTISRKYLCQQQNVLDCLRTYITALGKNGSEDDNAESIRLIAALCEMKLAQALASKLNEDMTAALSSASKDPTKKQDLLKVAAARKLERSRRDNAVYDAVRRELLAGTARTGRDEEQAELIRQTQLVSYEALTWLTSNPIFKAKLAADSELLKAACKRSKISGSMQVSDVGRLNGPLHLSLATILCNLTAYKPEVTEEEKQLSKLRQFAAAQGSRDDNTDMELLQTDAEVERRCAAVVDALGIEALFSIVASGKVARNKAPKSMNLNESEAVCQAASQTIHNMLVKQDRASRARVGEHGGFEILAFLSLHVATQLYKPKDTATTSGLFAPGKAKEITPTHLLPIQATCKFLISFSPEALFPNVDGAIKVVPLIAGIVLCPAASRLQVFEGLLALTNLSTISDAVGLRIAHSSLASPSVDETKPVTFGQGTVLAWACETLVMEDHPMTRKAIIELLVNLVHVYQVKDFLTDHKVIRSSTEGDQSMDRFTLMLKIVLSAAEADVLESGNDYALDSVARRTASLALLCVLSDASSVCRALLRFGNTIPVLLSAIESITNAETGDQMARYRILQLAQQAASTLNKLTIYRTAAEGKFEARSYASDTVCAGVEPALSFVNAYSNRPSSFDGEADDIKFAWTDLSSTLSNIINLQTEISEINDEHRGDRTYHQAA